MKLDERGEYFFGISLGIGFFLSWVIGVNGVFMIECSIIIKRTH